MILLHRYLKLPRAGVFLSDWYPSQKTSIEFAPNEMNIRKLKNEPLIGSGHIATGLRKISLDSVTAYYVEDPSYVHQSNSSSLVTFLLII